MLAFFTHVVFDVSASNGLQHWMKSSAPYMRYMAVTGGTVGNSCSNRCCHLYHQCHHHRHHHCGWVWTDSICLCLSCSKLRGCWCFWSQLSILSHRVAFHQKGKMDGRRRQSRSLLQAIIESQALHKICVCVRECVCRFWNLRLKLLAISGLW